MFVFCWAAFEDICTLLVLRPLKVLLTLQKCSTTETMLKLLQNQQNITFSQRQTSHLCYIGSYFRKSTQQNSQISSLFFTGRETERQRNQTRICRTQAEALIVDRQTETTIDFPLQKLHSFWKGTKTNLKVSERSSGGCDLLLWRIPTSPRLTFKLDRLLPLQVNLLYLCDPGSQLSSCMRLSDGGAGEPLHKISALAR